MFTNDEKKVITARYNEAMDRIKTKNIGCFKDYDKPLFLISDEYPGVWLEHAYDSVFFAKLEPQYADIAKNVLKLFLDRQKPDGQLPCFIIDRNKNTSMPQYGYSQIQECVSFLRLCFEYFEISDDLDFLKYAYDKGKNWVAWCEEKRMPRKTGLIEMFCGYDDGHDNSPRKKGMKYSGTAKNDDAAQYPESDEVLPVIAPDVNAVYFGDLLALSDMAKVLKIDSEAEFYKAKAEKVKRKIIDICYDEEDEFFYDVDKNGKKINLDRESYMSPSSGIKNINFTLKPKLDFPGADELEKKLESYRVFDPMVNCNMDNPDLREIDLALDEIYKTVTSARYFGAVDDPEKALAEEIAALKKAGIDTYINQMQKRMDEYAKTLK